MHTIVTIVAAVVAAAAFLEAVRRWVVRPLRRFARWAGGLAEQLHENSGASRQVAFELSALSGAITAFAVSFVERLEALEDEKASQDERLDNLAELLTDALADIARLERKDRRP